MARAAARLNSSARQHGYVDTLDPRIYELALACSQYRRRYRKRAPPPPARRAGRASGSQHGRGHHGRRSNPVIFVMSGVALLLMRSTERNVLVVAWAVLIGTGVFFAAIAAL
jgi:hypothetical protein